MKPVKVHDLMVPLAKYASVSQEATLYEAVLALEEAQQRFHQRHYPHRAVLVFDENKQIVGKLSQLDVVKGLEKKSKEIGDFKTLTRFGFGHGFVKSMLKDLGPWQQPLDDICRKAARIKVKDIMYSPAEGDFVQEDTSLDEAIHQLATGGHQSLLVTRGQEVVGILRLTDVFAEICSVIKASPS